MATSVKLDDDLKNRIQHLTNIWRRLVHWIMHEAIRDYVEREKARMFQARGFGIVDSLSVNWTTLHWSGSEFLQLKLSTKKTDAKLMVPTSAILDTSNK
ncbi:MAG: ribbon-helix-helix protein, CopG family [Methylococcales bacterium]